jgi:hypothetical protein
MANISHHNTVAHYLPHCQGLSLATAWRTFVTAVQTHPDPTNTPPFHPGGEVSFVEDEEGNNIEHCVVQNGPWQVFSCFRLENMLNFIPVGDFWIGLHGRPLEKQALPTQAGALVGFRRKGRPQRTHGGGGLCTLT